MTEINATESGKRHIEIVSNEMVEILGRMTPTERLAMAHGMWQENHQRIHDLICAANPGLTAEQVNREVCRQLPGADFPEGY
ncbi:MAG: hypothetical protein KDA89_04625 [Planctomycetaceae bacterium]|nr:hypothetical protein [Planctomycetaceae bacterium]